MAQKRYPFSADKHAHDIELVANRAYNLAQEALDEKRFDDYDAYMELHNKADEVLLAIQGGMVNYKVAMLDGETLSKANELVATATAIRDGISFQYPKNEAVDYDGLQNELNDGSVTADYLKVTSLMTSDNATYDDAVKYHTYMKDMLFPKDKVRENISAIEKRFELSEADTEYVSNAWQTCILDKSTIADRLSAAISENQRNAAYIEGVDELMQKLSKATEEGNTEECDYLKSAILEGSKSFAKRSVEGQSWNDITSLTLFMDKNEVGEILKKPNAYEELLKACNDFVRSDGLEHYMCKNIDRLSAKECYPVEKASVFTIISSKDEVTGEKGYVSAYLTTQGDISKVPNAQVQHYAAQARVQLQKTMHSLKSKGTVKDPVFVEYKDMVVLSFLAKMNSSAFETYKKQAASGNTKIKPETKELDYDTLKDYEKLQEGVKSFFESGKYKDYLQMCSHFHNYSFHNSLLIWLQKPDATRCASIKVWNTLGRKVTVGSKGIKIFAPCKYKLTDKEKEERGLDIKEDVKELRGFKIVNTFDLSQTEGKPLPSICEELKGTVSQMNSILKGLENVSGIKIGYENITNGAKGYYSSTEQKIVINEGMDNLQTVKTAIHETAHSLFDNPESKYYIPNSAKCDKEVRAESVAFMVASRLGLDTSEYSFAYVASWSSGKTADELQQNMNAILKGTNDIFEGINKQIKLVDTTEDMREFQMQALNENNNTQSAAKNSGVNL